jgi:cytochrome d ubiquinol oxidase subunit I
MELDALFLSRVQFAFTISFHIIFPAFTIGLASWLVALEFQWLRTGQPIYRTLFRFWVKVFAISFGLGVVSGIVMSYQFGTNWSRFSDFAGNIVGPLIAYEVLTAFFLEASFLGIMLFGWEKVGDRLHFLSTCLVALGTLVSAFWILSANSWMQTPDGFAIENGMAVPVDWWKIVFNPSFPNRFAHMVLGCYLTTAFAVGGMSAWMILHAGEKPPATVAASRRSMSMALWFAAIFAPVQIVIGDLHGLTVLRYQPTKLAAIEANWERRTEMPLLLFAIPDEEAETKPLRDRHPEARQLHPHPRLERRGAGPQGRAARGPAAGVAGVLRFPRHGGDRLRHAGLGRLEPVAALARRLVREPLVPARHHADDAIGLRGGARGWYTAEIGRQPFVVYGHLRTADAVSPVTAEAVGASLAAFIVVYAVIFTAGSYYLAKLLRRGPEPFEEIHGDDPGKKPKRPLSVPDEDFSAHQKRPQPAR